MFLIFSLMVNSQVFKLYKNFQIIYHVQLHHHYFADFCIDTCLYTSYFLINAELIAKNVLTNWHQLCKVNHPTASLRFSGLFSFFTLFTLLSAQTFPFQNQMNLPTLHQKYFIRKGLKIWSSELFLQITTEYKKKCLVNDMSTQKINSSYRHCTTELVSYSKLILILPQIHKQIPTKFKQQIHRLKFNRETFFSYLHPSLPFPI